MFDELHPDAERGIVFLSWLSFGGPIYLEQMQSEGSPNPIAEIFAANQSEDAKSFVSENNSENQRRNVYWLPNAEFLSGKRAKANLSAVRFLHADLDCKDYPGDEKQQKNQIIGLLLEPRERPKGIPAPTAVWFTGGGYQAIWRLTEPLAIEQAEELNEAILGALQGGAGTHDASRLLRLPWTVNWLNDKKRKDGRQPARAFVLNPAKYNEPPASYAPEDFQLGKQKKPSVPKTGQSNLVNQAALEPLQLPDDLGEILPPDPDWIESITTGVNPPSKNYQSRSELVFAASLWMLSHNVKPGHVVSILTGANFGISAHVLEKPNSLRYAQRQVQSAMKHLTEGDGKSVITLSPGHLPQIVDAAEQALLHNDTGIYQRFDGLVRVVRLIVKVDEEGVGRDTGALVLKPISSPWLREQFARVAIWERPTKEGATRTNPPSEIATTYLARVGEWKLRFLQGITQSPTLRADRTVLQESGYDPASCLLYDPGHMYFPEIAEAPTKEEALEALQILGAPFRDFCFASEADRSVALAAVLIGLVRTMFPSAPLFAIDAPTAGTGKSLLTETIAIIITGHKPAMMSQGKNDEENEKRLSSVLMAGDQVIVIDNCDRPIEGDFLCSMLTQEMVQPRILGKSETRRLPTQCLVLATGNNLVLSGDVTRRTLMCRLDAKVERPDQIQFPFDPRTEALTQRPQLVAAGLTILRAYIAAGYPNTMNKIGSFEAWNIIRESLVWLECHDPEDTRDRILADDPQKAVLLDLLQLWRQTLGDQRKTLTEIVALAYSDANVRKLVDELTANTRQPYFNARSVGRFLAKHLDRVVGGHALRADADSSGIKRYRVVDAEHRGGAALSPEVLPF
jgi:hypothetical protein